MRRNLKESNIVYAFKLSLITTSTGAVITETDSITTMFTFLSTYTLVANTTLRFNSSDNFIITSTLDLANNTAFTLTVTTVSGYFPSIDGQNTLPILMQVLGGKIIINNIFFKNAVVQAADIGQTMVRVQGGFNGLTITNCRFSHGFCAMRGTGGLSNITITDCKVYQVDNGSFRFGDGANPFPDVTNLNITRCQFIDDLNGGIIPNGYGSKYSPFLLIKVVSSVSVSNCIFQQTQQTAIGIETSNPVNVSNIQCWDTGIANPNYYMIALDGSTNVTLANCFLKPNPAYINPCVGIISCSNIKMYYCTLIGNSGLLIQQSKVLLELAGCIITGGFSYSVSNVAPYVGTIATDYVSENNNVLTSLGEFDFMIGVYNTTYPTQFAIRPSFSPLSFVNYQNVELRGQNTQIGFNSQILITDKINTEQIVLPSATSLGYKLVQSQISTITTDLTGKTRTYPTNAGAFD